MKKISLKLSLLATALLGIGSIVFTNATMLYIGTELQGRDNMNFISQTFWNANPTSGDIVHAMFGTAGSGTTAYTKNRSGYTATGCDIDNMTVNYVNPTNFNSDDNQTLPSRQIFVLESGHYSYSSNNIQQLDVGGCIGIVGSGDVTIDWNFDISNTNNIIIDNIKTPQTMFTNKIYSNTGNEQIGITLNTLGYNPYVQIIGDIQNSITGVLVDNTITTGDVVLTTGDGVKNINIVLETGTLFLNHFASKIILDTTDPVFTGTTQENKNIISGGNYNTGVSFTFNDTNISGATINGLLYTSGSVLSGEGNYILEVKDLAGNKTGLSFKIDYTLPTFAGTTADSVSVTSGSFYRTGVSFTFNDTNISGATINGLLYTGSTVLTGDGSYIFVVSDKAGNSTGTRFSIDTNAPVCNSYSPTTGATISAPTLTLSWNCTDSFAGISDQTVTINDAGNTLIYSTGVAITGTSLIYTGGTNIYNWKIIATDKAGNQSSMLFQKVDYTKPLLVTLHYSGSLYQGRYYVNNANQTFSITGNMAFIYQFTGNIVGNNSYMYNNGTVNRTITLSGADGIKSVAMNYGTGIQTGAIGPMSFYLDTTNPVLTGVYPTPLLKTKQSTINFQRTATDTGAGISNYILEFGNIASGTEIVYTGSTTNYNITNLPDGIYQWKLTVVDFAGNTKSTNLTQLTIDNTVPVISGVTGNVYYSGNITPVFLGTGTLNGKAFASATTITGEGNYTLIVTNDVGTNTTVNFGIDKTRPQILLINPLNGEVVTSNNTIQFLRNGSDANISGYIFNLVGPDGTTMATTSNTISIPNITNGDYTWDVKIMDKAGNEAQAAAQSFKVNLVLSGTYNIVGTTGTNGNIYTKTTFGIQVLTNKSANITIGGNILGNLISASTNAGVSQTIVVNPSAGDGIKTFTILANTGVESFSGTIVGYVDTTAPSTPNLNTLATNYSGAFTVAWPVSTDAGIGMSDYMYNIMSGSSIVKSGTTTTASISVANLEIGTNGTYTLNAAARDKLGNTSIYGSMTFLYTGIADTSVDSFSLDKEYDVDLDSEIKSNKITVAGLSSGTTVLASVDEGTLFVNGEDVGTEASVKNGDKVQIAIQSSEEYDDITSGILTIGDRTSTFKVTTIADDNGDSNDSDSSSSYDISELSTTQKLHISLIYNTLSELYSDSKQEDFMVSLKALVKDKIEQMETDDEDTESIETMMYLYNLINNDFDSDNGSSSSSSSTYTAPNGKEYKISKDSEGYTSSNFVKSKYFDSRDEIESYIDKNNPKSVYVGGDYSIDQSRTSTTYKAPNGKVYNFFKTTTGKYGSSNFASVKLFNDVATMKKHIDLNNPKG